MGEFASGPKDYSKMSKEELKLECERLFGLAREIKEESILLSRKLSDKSVQAEQ